MTRILLVEDDLNLRHLMSEVLDLNGYEVTAVKDGREALTRLRANDLPDLIMSDLLMEPMGGAELLDAVRSEWLWHEIPFVLVSGSDHLSSQQHKLRHKPDGYVGKPFGIPEMLLTVERALASSRPVEPPAQQRPLACTGS
jgi:CheY-like chemotaxis protein